MAKLYDFKVSGRTSASADGTATGIIATKAVEYHSDGSIRFTNTAGKAFVIQPDQSLSELFKLLFTGVGGVATGSRFHGSP